MKSEYILNIQEIWSFYTLLREGILILSMRLLHLEILIWAPLFLGDVWSAQNCKTFKELQTWKFADRLLLPIRWLVLKMGYIGPQSGTCHISQIGKLGAWAHGTSDSHEIWYLGLCTNSKQHYQKLSSSVRRDRYLPYKSNRYTGVLTTWNIRFTPNLIFKIIC